MIDSSNRKREKTALITGASAGIGLELARIFAKDKFNLVLVARREDSLRKLADELSSAYAVECVVIAADLTEPTAPTEIYECTQSRGWTVDVLANNAGFGANGRFANLDLHRQLNMLQVNVTALVHLTRLYLPGIIERNQGGILNVASTAAFIPGPFMSVYYATKAFVLSFTEALAEEVSGSRVHVSCLCPGATATEFQQVADMTKSKLFTGPMVMDAATVAQLGYEGFRRNQTVVVCGIPNQLAVGASRIIPRHLAARFARRVQEL